MILAETYTQLITDPAHIMFEVTLELISGVAVYPLIRWGHKKWEARVHKEIDAEHGVAHHEGPRPVKVVVMEESTYHLLVDKMGKDAVSEAEKWIG